MANPKPNFTLDPRSDNGPCRDVFKAFSQQNGSKGESVLEQGRTAAGAATEAWTGVVTGTVELANRLINEQIELGKKVAGQLNNQGYGFGDALGAPQDLAETMIKSFAELSTGWLKMMTDMTSSFVGATGRYTNGASAEPNVGDAALDTTRNAEVTASIVGVTSSSQLVVAPLTAEQLDNEHSLTEFRTATVRPFVTIRIPPDQPPGAYFGAVFDRSQGKVAGWVCVAIRDAATSAPSSGAKKTSARK